MKTSLFYVICYTVNFLMGRGSHVLVCIGCNDTAKDCDVSDASDVTIQCILYIPWTFFINEAFICFQLDYFQQIQVTYRLYMV